MYIYDVYKDGELLATNLYRLELLDCIGISDNALDYHHDRLIEDDDTMDIKGYQVVRSEEIPEGKKDTIKLMNDWDHMTMAAELIKTGQGYIKTILVDGKPRKVTVPR